MSTSLRERLQPLLEEYQRVHRELEKIASKLAEIEDRIVAEVTDEYGALLREIEVYLRAHVARDLLEAVYSECHAPRPIIVRTDDLGLVATTTFAKYAVDVAKVQLVVSEVTDFSAAAKVELYRLSQSVAMRIVTISYMPDEKVLALEFMTRNLCSEDFNLDRDMFSKLTQKLRSERLNAIAALVEKISVPILKYLDFARQLRELVTEEVYERVVEWMTERRYVVLKL
jgi:hypothetical protein